MDDNQIKKFANNLKDLVNSTNVDKIEETVTTYLGLFDKKDSVKIHYEYFRIFNESLPLSYLISKNKTKNFLNCLNKLEMLNIRDIKKEWSSWSKALIDSLESDFREYSDSNQYNDSKMSLEKITERKN